MQDWKKPLLVSVISAGALWDASAVFAQSGPASDGEVVEQSAAVRALVLIEEGPLEELTFPDGTTAMAPTSIVTRYICGSDTTGRTVADLEQIAAQMRAINAAPEDLQLITGSGLRGGLTINWNVSGSPPVAVTNLLADISTFYNGVFSDPVTISITFSWQNLGGGVLGATGVGFSAPNYNPARDALVADMDADDVIQNFLPDTATLPVMYDFTTGTITNETRVFVSRANAKALGMSALVLAASMQINSAVSWDFDESNGVPGSSFGLQSVLVHEVGHALGFTSGVDFRINDMEMMDLYRFDRVNLGNGFNPATFHEFESGGPRLVDFNNPDDRHVTEMITVNYRMEDGSLQQASHFRQQFANIGIMDPVLAPGESFWPDFLKQSDRNVFDAIGWDIITGPCTTLGDVDMDGDVDLRDVQMFQDCFDPGLPTGAGCECADVDHRDNRVNLFDWEIMERALMTGP